MGWGVNDYPSAPLEPAKGYQRCEGTCKTDIAVEEIAGACQARDCHREFLCFGCSYECRECGGNFCRQHIVVRNVGEPVDGYMASYTCETCAAAHTAQTVAA